MSNVEIEQAIREATNQLNRSSANACRLAENAAPEDAEPEGHDSDGEVSFTDAIASLPLEQSRKFISNLYKRRRN